VNQPTETDLLERCWRYPVKSSWQNWNAWPIPVFGVLHEEGYIELPPVRRRLSAFYESAAARKILEPGIPLRIRTIFQICPWLKLIVLGSMKNE